MPSPSTSPTSPQPYGMASAGYRLPDATRLGAVHLQVADLGRSVAYYSDVIGLRVVHAVSGVAELAAYDDDRRLVVLHERRGAAPVPPQGRLGLFHVAILLPDRPSLGRFLAHLAEIGEAPGMSDHYVSEAIYLTDPDGLGLEIYVDRPRVQWAHQQRQLSMATVALDVRAVIAAGDGAAWHGAPAGTSIGHVHLHVGDLAGASAFYHEMLGMDRMVWEYPGALFLAAGGYHHHVGTNTWARHAESARADEAHLMEWTIEVPVLADVEAVAASAVAHHVSVVRDGAAIVLRDPWGTTVRIRADSDHASARAASPAH